MTGAAKRIIDSTGLDDDEMGQGLLQWLMLELLRPLIARLLRTEDQSNAGEKKHAVPLVGADTYFYYVEGDSTRRLAPDLYVLPGVDPAAAPASWSLWQLPHPPSFALEIVGTHPAKDYDTVWSLYDLIGTRELVVFDPAVSDRVKPLRRGTAKRVRVRARWQIWRRGEDGCFALAEHSNEDRVHSSELRCWLRVVGEDSERRLRVGTGPLGQMLLPTGDELAVTEREAKEQEREAKEQEREAKEQEIARRKIEQQARLEAEAQVRSLEAKLAKFERLEKLSPSKTRSKHKGK